MDLPLSKAVQNVIDQYPITRPARGLSSRARYTVAASDTEYSQALPSNVLGIIVHNLSSEPLRIAFATGAVADPTESSADEITVAPYQSKPLGLIAPGASTTLYYASTLRGSQFDLELEMGSI